MQEGSIKQDTSYNID